MANIIIPAEHQSTPRETDIDLAIRKSAEEWRDGVWAPPADFNPEWITGTEALAEHPRVQEALERLGTQVQDRTSDEYLEKAQELHELNENAASSKKWPGQQRWLGKEAEAMRVVNPMTPLEFVQKLQAVGVGIDLEPKVEREYKADDECVLRLAEVEHVPRVICIGRRLVEGYVGVFADVPRGDGTKEAYKLVTKLQYPKGPEWDLLRFDEWGVPIGKRYHGWRTAVLALVNQRLITEEQAVKAFGEPKHNAASLFYRQQMHAFRNGRA